MSATLFVALLAVGVPVKEPAQKPTGPAPQVVIVHAHDNGKAAIRTTVTRVVPTRQTITVQVGNKQETREITVNTYVAEEQLVEVDGDKIQVYKADGKKVDPKDIKGLFKGQTPVLMSTDGKPVDPFYLRLLKEDALILVGQPQPTPPATVPTPVPPVPMPPDARPPQIVPPAKPN